MRKLNAILGKRCGARVLLVGRLQTRPLVELSVRFSVRELLRIAWYC